MSNRTLRFMLAASLILNLAVFATAGYRYYMQSQKWLSPFGNVVDKNRFLFEELSLQPEQLKEMKSHALLFRAEIDRRRQEIAKQRKELLALMRRDSPDKKDIEKKIKEISDKQEYMQRMIAMHMLEVKMSLGKDQQLKFMDLIEQVMTSKGRMGCPSQEGM